MALTETLKAISDSRRREVLELLLDGPMAAGDIASRFNLSAATVSHHLSQLKQANLVRVTRDRTFLYYELNLEELQVVSLWLEHMNRAHGDGTAPKRLAATGGGLA